MSGLPILKPKQVQRALMRAGFHIHHQRGSHIYLKYSDEPGLVTVPMHNRDLKRKVLASILNQAGLTVEEFKEFL